MAGGFAGSFAGTGVLAPAWLQPATEEQRLDPNDPQQMALEERHLNGQPESCRYSTLTPVFPGHWQMPPLYASGLADRRCQQTDGLSGGSGETVRASGTARRRKFLFTSWLAGGVAPCVKGKLEVFQGIVAPKLGNCSRISSLQQAFRTDTCCVPTRAVSPDQRLSGIRSNFAAVPPSMALRSASRKPGVPRMWSTARGFPMP